MTEPTIATILTRTEPATCTECRQTFERPVVTGPGGKVLSFQRMVTCRACDDRREAAARARREDAVEHTRELEADQRRKQARATLATPPMFREARLDGFTLDGYARPDSPRRMRRALEKARELLDDLVHGREPQDLFLAFVGIPGDGKTALAYAIANQLVEQHDFTARAVTCADLIRDLRASWNGRGGDDEDTRLQRYIGVDFLLIDEVSTHALYGKQVHQHLWDVINARIVHLRPTVITSNEDDDGLAAILGISLRSRLNYGGLVRFPEEDFRARRHAR